MFIGRTDVEAETPILWPPDAKRLFGKDFDPGKDRRQKEKAAAEDEMVSFTDSRDVNLSKLQEIVEDRGAWHTTVHEVSKSWT